MVKKKGANVIGTSVYNEAKWRAQDDARILADAEAIKKDSKRMSAAAKAASTMAQEAKDKATAIQKIARKSGK